MSLARIAYARIIRAAHRGVGVTLTPDEVMDISHDDAAIMSALGGDNDAAPDWLTPTERRRVESGGSAYRDTFRPGRDVRSGS